MKNCTAGSTSTGSHNSLAPKLKAPTHARKTTHPSSCDARLCRKCEAGSIVLRKVTLQLVVPVRRVSECVRVTIHPPSRAQQTTTATSTSTSTSTSVSTYRSWNSLRRVAGVICSRSRARKPSSGVAAPRTGDVGGKLPLRPRAPPPECVQCTHGTMKTHTHDTHTHT